MAFVVSEGALTGLQTPQTPPAYRLHIADGYSQAYSEIWKKQQAVRTVVSFLGRNIASIGLHLYERVSDTDRRRVQASPVLDAINRPVALRTRFALIDSLVQDLAIYDAAFLVKLKNASGGQSLLRLPPEQVVLIGKNGLTPDGFRWVASSGFKDFSADQVIYIHGYNPQFTSMGSSPIESLRRILAEEFEAGRMREQILRNGARANGYLLRPLEAPAWSSEAQQKFSRSWKNQYAGGGPEAGGTPILEDGMTFVNANQTAQQLQYIESRKLTREEVAAAYFIPPPMVGIMDGATFSNITEQHKMLYQDTLGPWLTMIEQELNAQLVDELGESGQYLEFNIQSKMQGSFEEQAASMSTASGAPWMTRNEIRRLNNLPAIAGGDELVTPLNVLVGGQASPADSGSQNVRAKSSGISIKAQVRSDDVELVAEELERFFKRQAKSVLSALGAKASDWWDKKRWDRELADELNSLALVVSEEIGVETASALGFPGAYDLSRTVNFLRVAMSARAEWINETTRAQIEQALAGNVGEDAERSTPEGVFKQAVEVRAPEGGQSLATMLATFAVAEAGKHIGKPGVTKTWRVTSSNPRNSHVRMNGETVGIDKKFSNGMLWPGDFNGGADEVASCRCNLEINSP